MLSALKISKNSALDVIHTENDTDNGNIFHCFHILYLKELIMKEAASSVAVFSNSNTLKLSIL